MRDVTVVCGVVGLACVLACGGGGGPPTKGGAKGAESPVAGSYKFGEKVKVGDLVVSVVSVRSGAMAGKHRGQFTPVKAAIIRFTVENTAAGKIADWDGWQGSLAVEDEHGNKFAPMDLSGWTNLPHNGLPEDEGPDRGARIAPGTTHKSAVYCEFIPKTSTQVKLSATVAGKRFEFSGPREDN